MKLRKNEMKLRKNEIKVPKNFLIPPWTMAVPYGGKISFLGGQISFLRRKRKCPTEEKKVSKRGMILENLDSVPYCRLCVLFLKKVHSWEGVTEMVHGLFLLFL